MASGFGNAANAVGGAAERLNVGPDLETIQTEALGFLSVAGDAKVRLTTPWPSLPAPTSSLLTIASRKGLVAAAGPDQVVIAKTESVRKAFESPKDGESDIRAFEPQLIVPMPMRISQIAFTADENFLVLTAETGGGLAVYEVQSLLQGSSSTAFELATNGEPLRSLIPNPTPDKAELCAIVTTGGNLHMANLKERRISNVLKGQVSCISWSAKGKQLCAGLADGSIHQMTPEGEAKAEIPKPPSLGNCHGMSRQSSSRKLKANQSPVSSLTWLGNNLFLAIHATDNDSHPSSTYHIITREPPSTFNFQRLADPVEPFGSDKAPHHSILRLRDFPPDLQDLLIVTSTASTEAGLLSRSAVPLASDKTASSITGVFTTTELLDDTKRPTLPMTDSMDDSTPVGVALDLSSTEKVYKPIPSEEEIEESPGPLPGLWILTHEGVLCSWWVVYEASIKRGTTYPGLGPIEGTASTPAPAQATPAAPASQFANLTGPAFGASAQLGQNSSPWGNAASTPVANTGGSLFGSSSFGNSPGSGSTFTKPSSIGFGQSSQLGMRTSSPWAGGGVPAPAFGQSGFSSIAKRSSSSSNNNNNSNSGQSPLGAASALPSSGGFSGFAKQSGFGSVAADKPAGSGVFGSGSKLAGGSFGDAASSNAHANSAFTPRQDNPSGGLFGSTPFKLQSSFKPHPSHGGGDGQSPAAPVSSMFGSSFGSALKDAAQTPRASTPPAKDEDMDTGDTATEQTPQAAPKSVFSAASNQESTTPTTTPAPTRFGLSSSPVPATSQPARMGDPGGLFGSTGETPKPSGFSGFFSSQPSDTPKAATESKAGPQTPRIKLEEQDEPLPPDTTSKAAYPLGASSSSSATSSVPKQPFGMSVTAPRPQTAPLPPDFTTPKVPRASKDYSALSGVTESEKTAEKAKQIEDAPLPPDFTKTPKSAASDASPTDPTKLRPSSKPDGARLPLDVVLARAPSDEASAMVSGPEDSDEGSDFEEDNASEGSGVDVAKDLSPITSGLMPTPGFTPHSAYGGLGDTTPATAKAEQGRPNPLFGEISRNAPLFPLPNATSPRSPSPVRGAVPQRVFRMDATRSVSAPGLASQILGPKKSQSVMGAPIVSREKLASAEDSFLKQHRKLKARQAAEEARPLVDEEDDEVQKVLASEVEGTLELDEFIAHSNVAPPARDSIPAQVEAVYRDINSMIDTLGLNARAVKAFLKGHMGSSKDEGRGKGDLEIPDDWVLCEVSELGAVLDSELYSDLGDGRVQDLDNKLDACQELSREMQRLRAKQEDLKRVIMARLDPGQAEVARTMPLSAEQAAQQNELRRGFAKFSQLLGQSEEAVTLLKTRIASASGSLGRGGANVPTVEAVMRTITKMTSMAEKRSGDIDVLETHMRKMRLGSASREGSPMTTPQAKKSAMMVSESTPCRTFRHSLSGSVSLGPLARATPPRKKLSGFSRDEKGDLMEKRARRQAVLAKFKSSVEKKGVQVWNMEDIE